MCRDTECARVDPQSQERLEGKMAKMLGVLMQACHSIGLGGGDGDHAGLLQVHFLR